MPHVYHFLKRLGGVLTIWILLIPLAGQAQTVEKVRGNVIGEWRSYGADYASTKYAPLDQINRDNVNTLRIAWRWESIDDAILNARGLWTWKNEATPLMIDGVLYTSTSLSQVAAIDARTGATRWSYDPQTYLWGAPTNHGFVHRGVAYWEDGADRRIFIATGDAFLAALDAATGEVITLSRGNSPIGWASEIGSRSADPFLRVFDPNDGTELAQIPLPGNATGAPMTYMTAGQQFIVVPIGGASQKAELVALTLGGATSVDETPPAEIALSQNYPNPFQGITTIEYVLPAPTRVALTVYDLLGRQVRTLVDEVRGQGRHQVQFDAAGLPSGMYFYRFETEFSSQTRQLVVVR